MSSLLQMLGNQLDEQTIKQISNQLGADETTTQQAISTALPMLVGALGRNAASADGAESITKAVQRDHDGSILNNPAQKVTNPNTMQDGAAILNHILGAKQGNVETGISRATGLDQNSTGQLLSMVAPLVMGALGQTQRNQGLDAGGVANLLQSERQQADSQLSGFARLLDMDGDGDITDDVINIGSKLLGGFFGKK